MSTTEQSIPRPEYPRPQWQRKNWQNLNGRWSFAFDPGNSGKDRGFSQADHVFGQEIRVPFCPESRLSGLGQTDFTQAVWYQRPFDIGPEALAGRILLHFGAVDYHCEIWINGAAGGSHDGGYSSFSFDITALVRAGTNILTVYAFDDLRGGCQPSGKQSPRFQSSGCSYTRTTGIWQTVWLEFVPTAYLAAADISADYFKGEVSLAVEIAGLGAGQMKEGSLSLTAGLYDLPGELPDRPERWQEIAAADFLAADAARAHAGYHRLTLKPAGKAAIRPWTPGQPQLYGLLIELRDASGKILDQVRSYTGFRNLDLLPYGLYLNGRPVFQRLVLDQGFYPEGIYTAPSDLDLKSDIERSMALGFNGARLHEKVFEARFLYWADRLGYLVWGEQANWGLNIDTGDGLIHFLPEWLEVLRRDRNHPAIIGWCPFNETWDHNGRRQCDEVLRQVYQVTKIVDPSRPVIDTSGNFHVATDIFDVHDYEQDPAVFAGHYQAMREGGAPYVTFADRQHDEGQPYMVSEYGGTWWNPNCQNGWGYGHNPQSETELAGRYEGLTRVLLDNPHICGFCYTQLTDVEQEQNGLYTYDRQLKFSPDIYARIAAVNRTPAAFEQGPALLK
ncbi:MAG: glycoside hydrolase family 2 TIM barrel-domain containing protein [Clostridiaceae bacterium]|nr:glycoside hydrolase family 2 TIM barrel-domain containing protein [Clostridiaceae bacterium]